MFEINRAGVLRVCCVTGFLGCGSSASPERVGALSQADLGTDITLNGTAIALVTKPVGSLVPLSIIGDGVFEPQGSTDANQQYNTYTGTNRTTDWIGYSFSSPQNFGGVVYQGGIQYWNGGWFVNIAVQVLQNGTWKNVSGMTTIPAFAGNNGINFETYTFTFPTVTGTGIRVYGQPGGLNTYTTTGQMRVYQGSGGSDAGVDASPDAAVDAGSGPDAAAHDSGFIDASDAGDAGLSDARDASVPDASDAASASDASDAGSTADSDADPSISDASDAGSSGYDAANVDGADDDGGDSGVATGDAGSRPDASDSGSPRAAYVRQWESFDCDGDCPPEGNSNNEAIYATLSPVLAGSTIVVFVTEANNGDMTTPPVTMSDSAGDSYTELGNVNDQPDQQANLLFVTTNVAATGNALKVTSAFDGVNQWQGIIVMEVAGTGPLSVVTSTSNLIFNDCCGSPGSLPDDFPSMTLTAPSLVIAMTNGFDVMTAGSGYTALGSAWDWMGAEGACNCNSATIEYGTFPVGIAAPTFTPIEPITNWMNLAVAIKSN
jgi:hypothetical protein